MVLRLLPNLTYMILKSRLQHCFKREPHPESRKNSHFGRASLIVREKGIPKQGMQSGIKTYRHVQLKDVDIQPGCVGRRLHSPHIAQLMLYHVQYLLNGQQVRSPPSDIPLLPSMLINLRQCRRCPSPPTVGWATRLLVATQVRGRAI